MVRKNNVKAKKIFCIVAYDVKEDRKRTQISKILQKYGIRINYSVFECMFTELQYLKVQESIAKKINKREDAVAFYPVCVNCFTKIIYLPKPKKTTQIVQVI